MLGFSSSCLSSNASLRFLNVSCFSSFPNKLSSWLSLSALLLSVVSNHPVTAEPIQEDPPCSEASGGTLSERSSGIIWSVSLLFEVDGWISVPSEVPCSSSSFSGCCSSYSSESSISMTSPYSSIQKKSCF